MRFNFVISFILIVFSSASFGWRASNGNRAMWQELNKKSPDCAAFFRITFRKIDKSTAQTTVRDTFIYEAANGKGFMDSEMNFDFTNTAAVGDPAKEAAKSEKIDTQLNKAEKGLKESKKSLADVMALKPPGDQIPDDEEKNIFSRICSMVADTGFRDKPPCPADMKGFKLNAQIILCKDAKAAGGKKK